MFAGTATAVGAWILLQLLGTGIGLSAIDTERASNLRGIGIGTGIWSAIVPFIALFLGALVGSRLAGTRDRRIGALHGIVMWGLTSALGLLAIVATVNAVAGGVAKVGSVAAEATGSAVKAFAPAAGGAGQDIAQTLGIQANDLLGPVNNYLQQHGKPPVTAEQLTATLRSVAQRGLQEGKIDRGVLVDELARQTSLSQADAEQLADQVAGKYQQAIASAHQKVTEIRQQMTKTASEAAHATGRAMLWGGIAELVALIAAFFGGWLGVPRYREREVPPANVDVDVEAVNPAY